MDVEGGPYKPRHHHLERRQGSSTGGVSQICWGNENEQTANVPASQPKERNTYAERNSVSNIFDFGYSPPVERPSTGRGRVFGAAHFSQLTLAHEEVDEQPRVVVTEQSSDEQPRSNPIFGGNFESMSVRQPVDASLDRPSTASQRSMRDPNRSSVSGGIFGRDACDDAPVPQRATPRRNMTNEEAQPAYYGAKRMGANGRMQYFA
ncbi:hypothetical protein T492DRAFT_1062037 [Pavlovales sp. CCMP2436]|nr:hypothetical protein T492DRAFT_1062037 [Pavlovales sp. CCMP2436]|mmetsp:Transcript_35385/g.88267  ORF Transcript_35385/g.88267 Transcript_35385/m.88267 type:complete len:206 (+) Transcript_35385:73-690(+)